MPGVGVEPESASSFDFKDDIATSLRTVESRLRRIRGAGSVPDLAGGLVDGAVDGVEWGPHGTGHRGRMRLDRVGERQALLIFVWGSTPNVHATENRSRIQTRRPHFSVDLPRS